MYTSPKDSWRISSRMVLRLVMGCRGSSDRMAERTAGARDIGCSGVRIAMSMSRSADCG